MVPPETRGWLFGRSPELTSSKNSLARSIRDLRFGLDSTTRRETAHSYWLRAAVKTGQAVGVSRKPVIQGPAVSSRSRESKFQS
jgi:hypothetical protein